MTRQDPQKTTGQVPYEPPGRCTCGHLWTVHAISEKTRERMGCSSWQGGRCRCKRYEEATDVA